MPTPLASRTDTNTTDRDLAASVLDDYDGLVYDLDGTLFELDVAWDAVRADAAAAYREAGVDPSDRDLWTLLEDAGENGLEREVEAVISRHERDGARSSVRLRLADALAPETRPVGVCTLNCEAAARVALDVHGETAHVDGVVGRDTVATHKPDPEPLLAAIRTIDGGLDPADVVFVGDSQRDADTADAAGTAFAWAADVGLD